MLISPVHDRPEQCSKVSVTAFSDSGVDDLATTGVVARFEPKPGAEGAAVFELITTANGGNDRGSGDDPDTPCLQQAKHRGTCG